MHIHFYCYKKINTVTMNYIIITFIVILIHLLAYSKQISAHIYYVCTYMYFLFLILNICFSSSKSHRIIK